MMREKGSHGLALFNGGRTFKVYDTDGELLFRQESYFFWLFGVRDEGYSGVIDFDTGCSVLFMPRLPESYSVWMGQLATPEGEKAKYAVDQVLYEDQLASWLQASEAERIHVMQGVNSDSGLTNKPATVPSGVTKEIINSSLLFNTIAECRVKKSTDEIEVIRYANFIGSEAHIEVMRRCKESLKDGLKEYQLESTFLHHCYDKGGCRTAMYTPIAASGPNGAILHYGHAGAPNDREIKDGDLVLCDFGCSIYGYGSGGLIQSRMLHI